MGIANPVTRETHGSGTHYHMQLAKQLGDMLQAPLEVCVNRATSKKIQTSCSAVVYIIYFSSHTFFLLLSSPLRSAEG